MTPDADVVVIGGGQSGLATGYHLRRPGVGRPARSAAREIAALPNETQEQLFTPPLAEGQLGQSRGPALSSTR